MKQLWAPWRIRYIQAAKHDEGCFLCENPQKPDDKANLVLYRGLKSCIIMNSFPYNAGHLMVAPLRHVANLEDLLEEERNEVFALVTRSVTVLKGVFKPEAFNIGINLGKVAGAGVAGHVHVHVVPRWNGDTNFMPVLADIKVINEALSETYDKLKEKF